MTNLCRILVFYGFFGALLGVLRNQGAVILMATSLLIALFLVALWFHVTLWWHWKRLEIHRTVGGRAIAPSYASALIQSGANVGTLWQGRPAAVELLVESLGTIPGSVRVDDLISPKLMPEFASDTTGVFHRGESIRLRYNVLPASAGNASFFGVRFVFQDPFGLFHRVRTIRQVFRFQTLPAYDRSSDLKPIVKRINALPRQGIHTLRRAGLGSELLELREYQTGDPPKSIAWKVSARRDMLMTRQYQSEVPVRIQLFLEGAQELHRGVCGERPVDWMRQFGASLTHAAVKVGDPLTITLIHQNQTQTLNNIVGDRGFHQALRQFAFFAETIPTSNASDVHVHSKAIELALWITRQWAPELLDLRVNIMLQSWFPLLTTRRRRRVARQALSLVFAEVFRLPTKVWMGMQGNDALFQEYLNRYLHCFEFPTPQHAIARTPLQPGEQAQRYHRFALALKKQVARAKDNQVFVLVSTAFTSTDSHWISALEVLSPVIRLAIAKHHRVVLVGVGNGQKGTDQFIAKDLFYADSEKTLAELRYEDILDWAEGIAERRKRRRMARQLKYTITKLGASHVNAETATVVRHVMSEADLAGSGRISRSSLR